MPRVLRIFNRLILGGPAFNVTFLTKFLEPDFETKLIIGAKDIHEQEATFLKEDYGLDPFEIKTMKREINFFEDFRTYRNLKKIITDFKPDIVHTHAAKPGALGRLAASACNVPIIIHTFHGHVFHSYFGKTKSKFFIQAERYLAKKTDCIIAISEQQKIELTQQFDICSPEKIEVIPLGIELNEFYSNQGYKRKIFREKYGILDNEIAIGIIGRIVPIKNHHMFIEAINIVLKKSTQKIKIIIIGDGDLRHKLIAQLISHKISYNYYPDNQQNETVVFTSWLTQMDYVYAGIDIVALSSLNEGTPVSLIEAQAANKPIVTTDVGGIRDIIIENETAFVTPSENVVLFSESILKLTENETLRSEMSQKGGMHVFEKYDKMRLVYDMRKLYYKLLNQNKIKY